MQKDKEDISRRRFLDIVLGGGVLAFLCSAMYPILRFITPPRGHEPAVSSVVAAKAGELEENSGKIFKFGNKPGILIRTANGQLKAFNAVCTHLNCTVQYDSESKHILCACHNGHFDLNGRVISGPPPTALEEYDVRERGDEIVVAKKLT